MKHTTLKFEQIGNGSRESLILDTVNLQFSHLRDLQLFLDLGLHAKHTLELNCDVLKALGKDSEKLKTYDKSPASSTRYAEMGAMLEAQLREQQFNRKSLDSICRRAERISQMVGHTTIF